MSQEKKELTHTEVIIPQNLELSHNSNPLELTKEFVEWMSGLTPDFRQNHKFAVDVQGKVVILDVVKETVEIRHPAYRIEINPLES